MTVTVTHTKNCAIPDDAEALNRGEVVPSDWNAGHTIVGIDAIESDIVSLSNNIRGAEIIDMGADDYTMTDAESQAVYKFVGNVGDGTKTLTSPTTADTSIAIIEIVDARLAGKNFTYTLETGGSLEILSGTFNILSVSYLLGEIQNLCSVCATVANAKTNGTVITDTANNVFKPTDAGKKMIFNNASPQAWTIDTTANDGWGEDAILYLFAEAGSGGLTVTGETGVTLSPASLVVAAGTGKKLAKDGATDTWNEVA